MTDSRTNRITFYVGDDEKKALEREAENAGESVSSYCLKMIRRQRQLETEEQIAEDLNVEERLAEITQQAVEEIDDSVSNVEDATEALRDLHARAGTYPLVNFRLLMRAHRPPQAFVSEQFGWASDRLRQPVNEHNPTEGIATSDGSEDDENTTTGTGPASDVDDLI